MNWEPLGNYEEAFRQHLNSKSKYHEKFTAPTAEILLVDDNAMNLTVFKSLIKKTLIKTDTALSGDEGINLSKEKIYDVIFLDHMMPEKDGIETLREIRADEDNPNIATPIICLTANAISGAREEYIKEGFDDYLTKPIDPIKLEETLLKYLPGDRISENTVEEETVEESRESDSSAENKDDNLRVLENAGIDTEAGVRNSG